MSEEVPPRSGGTAASAGPEPASRAADDPSAGTPSNPPSIEDFLGDHPTRDYAAWRWLWEGDRPLPVRSHRGLLGRLLVAAKRLLRPLVKVPANDLWQRQRVFNLILLERLQQLDDKRWERRLSDLEGAFPRRTRDLMRHNDALFARLDQKVDLYRRQAHDLSVRLGAALAVTEEERESAALPDGTSEARPDDRLGRLIDAREEQGYLELERRFRGTEEEIGERLAVYLPRLAASVERAGGGRAILDLGCGRGEALELFGGHGLAARGVDSSAAMVAHCRERGLEAEQADLFAALADREAGSLAAVVSFHVIEHLPAPAVDRLVRLAHRALAPGGLLILETPNPLSLVVAARSFWLDPTHRRPIHPDSLALSYRLAGFEPVERLDLRPFPDEARLPELPVAELTGEAQQLADAVNRLRDQLDDLLYGCQDYAMVGEKRVE